MIADLKEKKVSGLFWQYVVPSVLTMAALSLYYLIDSVFIARGPGLGDHAVGGMGVVLPVVSLLGAVGTLVSVGTSSRISLFWGAGDTRSAHRVMGTSILFILLLTAIFCVIIYLFSTPLLNLMGATTENFYFAEEFMIYFLPAALLFNLATVLTSIIRATGYPTQSLIYAGIGVICNLFFAPLYIFVFKWGMMGAAMAMFSATFVSLIFCIRHLLSKKQSIHIDKKDIKLDLGVMWTIASIGLAPFVMLTFNSLSILLINNRLSFYGGAESLSAYVMANRITFIIIMVLTGLSQGIQPIVGYNYGAKDYNRVMEVLKYCYKVGFLVGFGGLLIGLLFADPIISIFNPSADVAGKASVALKILTITLPLSALQMITGSFFQNIDMAAKAVFLNLSRQLLFLAPMLFILPLFWGVRGAWMALPLSEIFASILTLILLFRFIKQVNITTNKTITIN